VPAGLPECPAFHFAASLPETPILNLVSCFLILI
jgi:hypothetical protein